MDKHQHYTKASIQTADALPLAALRLVDGADWDVAALEKDACVSVWKNKDEPRLPDGLACNLVGVGLVRDEKKEQFCKSAFSVYYDGELVGVCEKEQAKCVFNVP